MQLTKLRIPKKGGRFLHYPVFKNSGACGYCAAIGAFAEAEGLCRRCGHLIIVVISRHDGIDQSYNQAHEPDGLEEIVRVVVFGEYRSDGLDGPL